MKKSLQTKALQTKQQKSDFLTNMYITADNIAETDNCNIK